jgi:hypothetical protein
MLSILIQIDVENEFEARAPECPLRGWIWEDFLFFSPPHPQDSPPVIFLSSF